MDLASRKYSFIQELTTVDESLLEKLEKVLKMAKAKKVEIPSEHKAELEKRLEAYKENPQDLLDWNEIKNEW